jgi:hypothetical protein
MHFNIRPWEIDLLTYREIESYLDAVRQATATPTRR